jgi:hypothetical protein
MSLQQWIVNRAQHACKYKIELHSSLGLICFAAWSFINWYPLVDNMNYQLLLSIFPPLWLLGIAACVGAAQLTSVMGDFPRLRIVCAGAASVYYGIIAYGLLLSILAPTIPIIGAWSLANAHSMMRDVNKQRQSL